MTHMAYESEYKETPAAASLPASSSSQNQLVQIENTFARQVPWQALLHVLQSAPSMLRSRAAGQGRAGQGRAGQGRTAAWGTCCIWSWCTQSAWPASPTSSMSLISVSYVLQSGGVLLPFSIWLSKPAPLLARPACISGVQGWLAAFSRLEST